MLLPMMPCSRVSCQLIFRCHHIYEDLFFRDPLVRFQAELHK